MDYVDYRSVYGRNGYRPCDECPFPVSFETVANTLAEFTDGRKLKTISQALRTQGVNIALEDYDNWDGGIWTWLISVFLSPRDWALFNNQDEITAIEKELTALINACIDYEEHSFGVQFTVTPVFENKRVTNQGRAHSTNIASIEYEGFLFRSQPEVFLFIALRNTGIPIMPLPVVAAKSTNFTRIEPDFVVIRRGMTFVIEVDGDIWHKETPAAAQKRLSHLEDEGVRVIRVSAKDCNSINSAKETAKKILIRIERILESR